MAKKEKQAVWLYPEVKELLTTHMAAANAMSQSDFIEKAIRFYAGYLDCNSENMTEYLGETVSAVIDGIVKGSEQRISRALFKLAVQSAIQSHILAAVTDVDETDVGKLYGMCTEDVPVNECGENFLYDEPDGTKSFSVEFFEFEHDTFVQICRELKLDYNKVKGGVLVYSQVTPDNSESGNSSKPMKLFGKTAPTKFTVHGNDDEGNALITGKLKVSSVASFPPSVAVTTAEPVRVAPVFAAATTE